MITFNSMKNLVLGALIILITGIPSQTSFAQIDIRGVSILSTAGGGAAFVRDNEALFLNPGNALLSPRRTRAVISLGNVMLHAGGSLVQFDNYNDSFTTGTSLSSAEVDNILNDWFGSSQKRNMRYLGVSAEIVPFALSMRGYGWGVGVAVRSRVYNRTGFTRGFFDLALRGTDRNATLPLDFEARSFSTTEIAISYSHLIPKHRIAVGITPKYVLGMNYARAVLQSDLTLNEGTIRHTFDYTLQAAGNFNQDLGDALNIFPSTGFLVDADPATYDGANSFIGGRGFGFDVGATHEVSKNLLVSLSFTDIGYVRWTKNADALKPVNNEFYFEGFDLDLDRINDEYDGEFGTYFEDVVDSLFTNVYDAATREAGAFTTGLPAAMHAGGSWTVAKGKVIVNAGTSLALNNTAGNMSRIPSLHFGTEVKTGRRYAFPLRTGVRIGGGGAATFGFGFGIMTPGYDLNIGIAATPWSNVLGKGGRYMLGVSLVNIRI